MPNWKSYKSQTPFQFVVAPSESYNEGSKIAFSPKIPGKSPVWSTDRSGIPITPTHTPCRYWTGEGWEWKSWLERICMGLEISYTQTMMFPDEQQALRVKDSNGDIVDIDIVTWILTGVGSISADIGSSITYTAPSESLGTDTAVIEMWCNGEVKDTLTITFPGKITYTTPQQPPGTTQDLPIDNPNPACTYTWTLVGGGNLNIVDGVMRYTAPVTNPNCENNATISLLCDGVVIDTIKIAINAVTGVAFEIKATAFDESTPSYEEPCLRSGYYAAWRISIDAYKCDGTLNNHVGSSTQYSSYPCWSLIDDDWANPSCCAEAKAKCENNVAPVGPLDTPIDVRTAAQIAAGCCPASLM